MFAHNPVNKRAKTLTDPGFNRLMAFALQRSRVPASDRLKLMLSFKAGLRVSVLAKIVRTSKLFLEVSDDAAQREKLAFPRQAPHRTSRKGDRGLATQGRTWPRFWSQRRLKACSISSNKAAMCLRAIG